MPEASFYDYEYPNGSWFSEAQLLVGDTLFFTADDGIHGAELWSHDTATGTTQLVDDINPGRYGSDPRDFVVWEGQLYFAANDGSSPTTTQLWTSGGTAASTSLVASLSPGRTAGSAPDDGYGTPYVTQGSQILLPLSDGVHGATRPCGRRTGPRRVPSPWLPSSPRALPTSMERRISSGQSPLRGSTRVGRSASG